MEKIVYPGSNWRIAQSILCGMVSVYFLTKSFRTGSANPLPCLVFLATAALLGRTLARRTLQLNRGLNDEIDRLVNPAQYLGSAGTFVDRVVARVAALA